MSLELSIPEFDETKFTSRRLELAQMRVPIPPDPLVLGYKGVNDLFSRLQGYLDRVHELEVEALQFNALAKAAAEVTKATYEAKRDTLVAAQMQEEYESFKAIEARVNVKLTEDKKLMQRAKIAAGLFASYLAIVESTRSNLESAKKTLETMNNNLKRQLPIPVSADSPYVNR